MTSLETWRLLRRSVSMTMPVSLFPIILSQKFLRWTFGKRPQSHDIFLPLCPYLLNSVHNRDFFIFICATHYIYKFWFLIFRSNEWLLLLLFISKSNTSISNQRKILWKKIWNFWYINTITWKKISRMTGMLAIRSPNSSLYMIFILEKNLSSETSSRAVFILFQTFLHDYSKMIQGKRPFRTNWMLEDSQNICTKLPIYFIKSLFYQKKKII